PEYFAAYHVETVGFLYERLRLGQLGGLSARPDYASTGTLTLDVFSAAGDAYGIALGRSPASIEIDGLGTLCIGPRDQIVYMATGTLPASPRLATDAWSFPVPPGLSGTTLYWQALIRNTEGGLLSNCVETPL
ncbi:MAG: hypothetical protein AAGG01_17675, partial [Planctomycetota bacterium]